MVKLLNLSLISKWYHHDFVQDAAGISGAGGGGICLEKKQDLAEVYFHWTGYAYGEGFYARKAPAELVDRCRRVTVTFEKFDSNEIDLLDCCHIYEVHGGFTVAAETASGKEPQTYFGDTHDPHRPVIRTLREELSRIAHTRLLNRA